MQHNYLKYQSAFSGGMLFMLCFNSSSFSAFVSQATLSFLCVYHYCISHLLHFQVKVDMGEPILKASDVPTSLSANKDQSVVKSELDVDGVKWNVTCVSMGNPHCVTFGTKEGQVCILNKLLCENDIFVGFILLYLSKYCFLFYFSLTYIKPSIIQYLSLK